MKLLTALPFLIFLFVIVSCKKEPGTQPASIPPNLTEKLWTLDTILINAPHTYDDLTDNQKFNYNVALAWSMDKAQITFKMMVL